MQNDVGEETHLTDEEKDLEDHDSEDSNRESHENNDYPSSEDEEEIKEEGYSLDESDN